MKEEEAIEDIDKTAELTTNREWQDHLNIVAGLARECLERRKQMSHCEECPACESDVDTKAYCNLCKCQTCKYRAQPDIGKVLDELEEMIKDPHVCWTDLLDKIREFRAKYCTPEPEKPTLKSVITQIVEHHKAWCNNDREVKFWNRLLARLKSVE